MDDDENFTNLGSFGIIINILLTKVLGKEIIDIFVCVWVGLMNSYNIITNIY